LQQQERLIANVQQRLKTSTNLEASVRDADLVIEAIVENLEAKRKLLGRVEAVCKRWVKTESID
jgi:3-hydroxyacyl-CoA dehydrogenase